MILDTKKCAHAGFVICWPLSSVRTELQRAVAASFAPWRDRKLPKTNCYVWWNLGTSLRPRKKQESSIWKHKSSPRAEKARVIRSAGKVMHLVFFDHHGVVYDHRFSKCQTIIRDLFIGAESIDSWLRCAKRDRNWLSTDGSFIRIMRQLTDSTFARMSWAKLDVNWLCIHLIRRI